MLKSDGKAQGKSTTGNAMLWLVSSPEDHKQGPSLALAAINKLLAKTTLTYFFDEISHEGLLHKLIEARGSQVSMVPAYSGKITLDLISVSLCT